MKVPKKGTREFRNEPVGVEAANLVTGARQKIYGDPIDSMTSIGRKWAATLGISDIPPHKVALMMIDLKTCRAANGRRHRDNEVDICGFAHILQMEREAYEGEEAEEEESIEQQVVRAAGDGA